MIKLSASVSRKVPVPNLEYSSQSFHGGVEVEVSDGSSEQQIRERLGALYTLLDGAVQAEITKAEAGAKAQQPPAPPPCQPSQANGNPTPAPRRTPAKPSADPRKASQAQVKAIFAITKSQGLSRESLLLKVQAEYGVSEPESLSMSQASELIQRMKGPVAGK